MLQELFLYDREDGLFKQILKTSSVMQGRYHVSPNAGKDLDTNNLETYMKDAGVGLTDTQKFPLCVCMTPTSRYIVVNNQRFEQFTFTLFFVCTSYYTGTNQIKTPDVDTNLSMHPVWYDWQDMKNSAQQFLDLLKKIITTKNVTIDSVITPLKTIINFGNDAIYRRLSKFNNNRLSGIQATFTITMVAPDCGDNLPEYPDITSIVIPNEIIHAPHTDN